MRSRVGHDLAYGARMLRRQPSFAFIAVLTLALGIGANTAIFSVLHAVIWRSLPYQQPEQLVMVWERSIREKLAQPTLSSSRTFLAWRGHKEVFSDVAAFEDAATSPRSRFFLTSGDRPERLVGAYVSGNLFSTLGMSVALGRSFTTDDEITGRDKVAILSDAFWRRRFGGSSDVIGQTIRLSDELFTIIGVAPPEFRFTYPKPTDLWTPMSFGPENVDGSASCKVVARLKPGVTLSQARATMTRFTQEFEGPYRRSTNDLYVQLDHLHEYHFGEVKRPLLLLLSAVIAVLLIACVNVTNLSLARAMDRSREMAVRVAIGASRGTLMAQMIIESLILAALGGAVGLILAFAGQNLLLALIPSDIPRSGEVKINSCVLGVTFLLSISAGLISGLVPAIQASKPDAAAAVLKVGMRRSASRRHWWQWRDWLIVAEVAISFVLLIGAGLMIRSFWRLHQADLGFEPKSVLTMQFTIPPYKFNADGKQKQASITSQERAFVDRIVERVKMLPGVDSAASSSSIPLRADRHVANKIIGKPGQYSCRFRIVSNDYFRTMGIRVLRGRTFTDEDTQQSRKVIVVSSEFVRRYFPNEDPLGQHLRDPANVEAEVVGVVSDVRHSRLDQPIEPAYYIPTSQGPSSQVYLTVHVVGDPLLAAAGVQRAVWSEDKDLPLEDIATMEQIRSDAIADSRFVSTTLGIFGFFALLLSAAGMYGVISYLVVQRKQEIGLRMALGARRVDILLLVLTRAMKLTWLGVAISVILTLWLNSVMKSLLVGVSATDPITFLFIAVLITVVAVIACWIPVSRATKAEPMSAIRYE